MFFINLENIQKIILPLCSILMFPVVKELEKFLVATTFKELPFASVTSASRMKQLLFHCQHVVQRAEFGTFSRNYRRDS